MQSVVGLRLNENVAQAMDPVLGAVQMLREPGALASHLGAAWSRLAEPPSLRSASILNVHYKPWSRARIFARTTISSDIDSGHETTRYLYLQVYASRIRAIRRFAKAETEKHVRGFLPAVSFLDACNAVVWMVPNDPDLKPVRTCMDSAAYTTFLSELGLECEAAGTPQPLPQLVRYVPRRRALFLHGHPGARRFYIKLYGPGQDVIGRENLKALEAAAMRAPLGFRTPRLLAHSAKRRALVMDEIPGARMTELLSDPCTDVFAAVGRALARLHMCDVTPTLPWTAESELAGLRKAMEDMVAARPDLNVDIKALLGRIDQARLRLSFDDRRPIHGNLFADQILIDGDQIGIVDWDDLPLGDPLFDVGRLIAHLIFVSRQKGLDQARLAFCVQFMLEAYERERGQQVAADRLRWHICVALLMRAKISALRNLPRSWVADVTKAVEDAAYLLDRKTEWVPK